MNNSIILNSNSGSDLSQGSLGKKIQNVLKMKNRFLSLFIVPLLILPCAANATVYKCVISGAVIYTAEPCLSLFKVNAGPGSTKVFTVPSITRSSIVPISAPAPAATTPPALTAGDYATKQLRGLNFGFSLNDGSPSSAKFDEVKATGANLLRVFMEVNRVPGQMKYQMLSSAQFQALDDYLSKAAARGMWVVVVLEPPYKDKHMGPLWTTSSLQDSYDAIVKAVAAHCNHLIVNNVDITWVVGGIDILNEPWPSGNTYKEQGIIGTNFAMRLALDIRSVNASVPIIYEPEPVAAWQAFKYLVPLQVSGVVYSLHMYDPMPFTHQKVYSIWPNTVYYGNASSLSPNQWTIANLRQALVEVHNFVQKYHQPVYVGEFSATRYAPTADRLQYLKDLISIFNTEGWAWTYENFSTSYVWDPEIISTDPNVRTRTSQSPVEKLLEGALQGNWTGK